MRPRPVLLLLALCACSAPSPPIAERHAAITNGADDDGDAGVVALLHDGNLFCTATLIAPRLILTAAHCLPDGPAPHVFFGGNPAAGGTQLGILATRRHPAFESTTLKNDIALALLDDVAPPGATPWPLARAAPDVGATLRLVGFGRTDAEDTTAARKRVGTSVLTGLDATTLAFAPSPSQTCEGDSGGPAFATLDGVETLVGVTSSGDPQCATMARDTRVDAYAADFITPWLAATADGAIGAGNRCWYDANCAPGAGACVPALDDPTLSFCSPSCSSDCPGALLCVADPEGRRLCRHPLPSPFALGAYCTADSQCESGYCLARSAGATSVCAKPCFVDLPGFCSDGFACVPLTGASIDAACFATRHAGCSFAPLSSAATGSPFALVATLLLLALWRRSAVPRA